MPPVEDVTLREDEETAPFLSEPPSEGRRPVCAVPRTGRDTFSG
ncbi:MAG: hypothetical protein ACP5JG_13145 [Anaerolineae bacterium]